MCELLLGNLAEAQEAIKSIEQRINDKEATAPAAEVLQERCWLLHAALFVFAKHPDGSEFFLRSFLRRECVSETGMRSRYLSAIELNAPWLLRYVAVVAVVQGKQYLARVAELLDRLQDSTQDPILLFLRDLLIRMDFQASAAELSRCMDVFASDYFLVERGAEYAAVGVARGDERRCSLRMRSCWCWSCCSTCTRASRWRSWREWWAWVSEARRSEG